MEDSAFLPQAPTRGWQGRGGGWRVPWPERMKCVMSRGSLRTHSEQMGWTDPSLPWDARGCRLRSLPF